MSLDLEKNRDDKTVSIVRTTIRTSKSYEVLPRAFELELNRLDPSLVEGFLERDASWGEIRSAIERVGNARGLMVLAKIDQGLLTSRSGKVKRCCLYLVGNPVIANDILDVEPRGAFYVPFRVALVEPDSDEGALFIYERPSSLLSRCASRIATLISSGTC